MHAFPLLNFEGSEYIDIRGKTQPMIRFSDDVLLNVVAEVGGKGESDGPLGGEGLNQLVPVFLSQIAGKEVQAVNLRDLHERLKVGRDFPTWIKVRLTQYEFVEGRDYVMSHSPNGGVGDCR